MTLSFRAVRSLDFQTFLPANGRRTPTTFFLAGTALMTYIHKNLQIFEQDQGKSPTTIAKLVSFVIVSVFLFVFGVRGFFSKSILE